MPVKTLHYTNGTLTIVWKPDICVHSTLCWKGLREVFNPNRKPWILAKAAPSDAIINQIRKCPSGALSYYLNDTAPDSP